MHLLFVCTGNICRSPTAERLATALSAQDTTADISASSAGTRAMIGHPVHPEAARVLVELGSDPGEFTARQLNARIASEADLVLAMTREHRDAVLELAPRQLRRAFTLIEAAALITRFNPADLDELAALRPQLGGEYVSDVADPIGQSSEVFDQVGIQIAELVQPIVDFCRHIA